MKPFLYRLICTHDAGWIGDSLWSPDYAAAENRIFARRHAACAVRDALNQFDYASTCELDDGDDPRDHQPSFAVEKVSAIEAIAHAALLACDDDLLAAVIDAADAPLPAGMEAGDMSREELCAWIATLPAAAKRAYIDDHPDLGAAAFSRASASLRGASSATHGLALLSGYAAQQAGLVYAACAKAGK